MLRAWPRPRRHHSIFTRRTFTHLHLRTDTTAPVRTCMRRRHHTATTAQRAQTNRRPLVRTAPPRLPIATTARGHTCTRRRHHTATTARRLMSTARLHRLCSRANESRWRRKARGRCRTRATDRHPLPSTCRRPLAHASFSPAPQVAWAGTWSQNSSACLTSRLLRLQPSPLPLLLPAPARRLAGDLVCACPRRLRYFAS